MLPALSAPGPAVKRRGFVSVPGKAEKKKWKELNLLKKLEKQRVRELAEKQAEEEKEQQQQEDKGAAAGGAEVEMVRRCRAQPGVNLLTALCPRAALHAERGPAGLHPEQRAVAGAADVPGRADRSSVCHLLRG